MSWSATKGDDAASLQISLVNLVKCTDYSDVDVKTMQVDLIATCIVQEDDNRRNPQYACHILSK